MIAASRNQKLYAYNYKGIPYDHQVDAYVPHTQIAVRKFSSAFALKDSHTKEVPSLDLTEAERNESDFKILWIGLYIDGPLDPSGHVLPMKGASINSGTMVTVHRTNERALRVGVDIRSGGQNKLYALINQVSGLCEAVRLPASEVFFFPEFRNDDLTAEALRASAWGSTIRVALAGIGAKAAATKKARQRTQTHGEENSNQEPFKEDVRNSVRALGATYHLTTAPWALDALEKVLTMLDDDLRSRPEPLKFFNLNLLFSIDEEFAEANAPECNLYQDLVSLSLEAHELIWIAAKLRAEKVVVPFWMTRVFIVEAVFRFRNDSSGCSMKDTLEHVRLLIGSGSNETPPAESDNSWFSLLLGIINHIQAIVSYSDSRQEAIRKTLGGRVTGLALDQVIDAFATSVDIDTADLAAREIFGHVVELTHAKDGDVTAELKDLLDRLVRLKTELEIRDEDMKDVDAEGTST
ncbi:MAG: hypothetical protein Q9195_001016 [Heterodermia aff. obscurata]